MVSTKALVCLYSFIVIASGYQGVEQVVKLEAGVSFCQAFFAVVDNRLQVGSFIAELQA